MQWRCKQYCGRWSVSSSADGSAGAVSVSLYSYQARGFSKSQKSLSCGRDGPGRASTCAKRGDHVQLCSKPRRARGIEPKTFTRCDSLRHKYTCMCLHGCSIVNHQNQQAAGLKHTSYSALRQKRKPGVKALCPPPSRMHAYLMIAQELACVVQVLSELKNN